MKNFHKNVTRVACRFCLYFYKKVFMFLNYISTQDFKILYLPLKKMSDDKNLLPLVINNLTHKQSPLLNKSKYFFKYF